MKANSPSVVALLRQIHSVRIPNNRLRGNKPSVVRFAYTEKLFADYGRGAVLTPRGLETLGCDCQAPEPEDDRGAALVSMNCPIHN